MAQPSLSGRVYGHPKFTDGEQVITTGIIKVQGRVIQTAIGAVYDLEGDPQPRWMAYIEKSGCTYDPDDPVALKTQSSLRA